MCVISQLIRMCNGTFRHLFAKYCSTVTRGTKEARPITYPAYSLLQMIHILYRTYVNLCKCLLSSCGYLFPIFFEGYLMKLWAGSLVVIATDYRLDGPGSNPGGDEIFRPSRLALRPIQHPVKWVPGLSRRVKCGRSVLLTTHSLLVLQSLKSRAITLPTLWATSGL